ncbi:hypothetical protein [Corynebacterium cystitidis]|uniref:Uncharacterized protein n=1 Tax=Corynebacterium cystitidis DSM 20524 TaxID=1121357 RepID=A0A1H9WKV1_9CORY|nr:hypothetical protein [Corynebacterium cystitidis]WJY83417.1 hypothetical protein CCYS_12650 [Corynebacterium cystitidis DSM 20524]SES34530.1 hypothetical protein SAMN05661109_02795 [Corynebacterium cystitidis DSM 20524]SNV61889.1 Uncharacterised protein [Corynebacterium cystitidis]
MKIPDIVVIEPTDEAFILDGLSARLAAEPRSCPQLDAFVGQLPEHLADQWYVAGDGVVGITDPVMSVGNARLLGDKAVANNVSIAVPQYSNVIARGHASLDFHLEPSVTAVREYVSEALIRETIRMSQTLQLPKREEMYLIVYDVSDRSEQTYVRTVWDYDNSDWQVEYKLGASSPRYYCFAPSDEDAIRLLSHWPNGGTDIASLAEWEEFPE